MYNIYKTNNIKNIPKEHNLNYLNILRFDLTEEDFYNFRYNKSTKNISNSNTKRTIPSSLKKIGFISRDFTMIRPSGILSQEFFECLQKYSNQFDIYFYSLSKYTICDKFKKFAILRNTTNNLNELKDKIIEDAIDILIDMQGHMVNNFNDLMLSKPAPIQIHFLGYPGTLGLPTIDYLIADKIVIPPESEQFYREKIAYMPNCYQCNNSYNIVNKDTLDVNTTRDHLGIPKDVFVFCNFNYDYKMDRKTWFIYLSILKKIPNSVLVYKIESIDFNNKILKDAELNNINTSRLISNGIIEHTQHLKRLSVCDLGLDTYRINGHTTSSDLIAAGTPFITYTSPSYHNRVGKSILVSLDLEELVCYSFDEYVNLAVKLSTNKEYYTYVKNKVIENRNKKLFNVNLYTNDFVNLLFNIWKNNYSPNLKTIWKCYKNTDSVGYDISTAPNEAKELHLTAINTENCVAYNTSGCLKYNLTDKKTWIPSSTDLWVKEELHEDSITKFGNNYQGTKDYKWIFYPGVDSCSANDEDIICNLPERQQLLRDLADKNLECIAFNTKGDLKRTYSKNFIPILNEEEDDNCGLWVKEPLVTLYDNEKAKNEINKDYNLPLICMIYIVDNTKKNYINFILKYHEDQLYLNTELLVVADNYEKIETVIISYNVKTIITEEKNINIIFKTHSTADYFFNIYNKLEMNSIILLSDYISKNSIKEKNVTKYLNYLINKKTSIPQKKAPTLNMRLNGIKRPSVSALGQKMFTFSR